MINRLRRFIFENSNLTEYVSILKQSKDQKVIRLLRDPSNPQMFKKSNFGQMTNENSSFKGQSQKDWSLFNRLIYGTLPVLNPITHQMLYWYVIVFLAVIYNYVQFPIVLIYSGAWQAQLTTPLTLAFSIITIIILLIDVIVQLNTGYLKRGMVILQRKRVVRNYLRGLFIIDITYIILVSLCLITKSYYLNHTKYLVFAKCFRLSEIDDYFMRRFNVKRIKKTIYTILKLVVIILVLSHAIGVIFYSIDYYIYTNNIYPEAFCWLYSSTAYSPIIQLPWAWQYFYSLYWGINTITTISYGDIQGANPTQVAYMLVCMCFGFMVYGYVVNQIIKIILWSRANLDKRRTQLLVMDMFMDNLKVPFKLKNQVKNHLQFMHKQERNRNLQLQTQMRDKLPEDLRYQLVANAYEALNQKIINIFMSSTATRFLFNLVQRKYTYQEQVSNQGERALSFNYLHKGKMQFILYCGQNQFTIYESEEQNQFLGHYELFARRRWPYSIFSKEGSTVYSISRQKMFQQINSNQMLRQRFKQVQYEVVFKDNLQRIYHTCFFCKVHHDWTKCPSKFPMIKSHLKTKESKRQDGIRIIRRKYHTLNDRKKLEVLRPIKNMANKKLVNIIEKRISKIRQKLNQRSEVLQIDVAFDWKYYDVSENLSKKKELWNELITKKLNPFQELTDKSSSINLNSPVKVLSIISQQ